MMMTYLCDACRKPLMPFNSGPHLIGGCASCGSVFLLETTAAIPEYEAAAGHMFDTTLLPLRQRQASTHLRLLESLTSGRRLLDIGAGRGWLVATARQAKWDAVGIDSSEASARLSGGNVTTRPLEDIEPNSFDVVTLMDVIEHVSDRKRILHAAARVLVDGGIAMVRVPNAAELVTRVKCYVDSHAGTALLASLFGEHKVYYTLSGLRELVSDCGFRIVDVRYEHEDLAVTSFFGAKGALYSSVLWFLRKLEWLMPPTQSELLVVAINVRGEDHLGGS